MTGNKKTASTTPFVNFIGDFPADEDFFDTHTRLARAIVAAIESDTAIKVIGLLGRWGSGKSTVAKKLVDLKRKKLLMEALGRTVGSAAPDNALDVLKAGGVQFLKAAGYSVEADTSIRAIVLPQLDRRRGRDWLKDNNEEIAGWIKRASPTMRAELLANLNAMLVSKREERRYSADLLLNQWGLNA